MRKAALNQIFDLAKKDDRVLFIGSDLGSGTLDEFRKQIPARFFMEAISEANMVGMATGFALDGKIPYVNTIATFLTRRSFEQVVIDVSLHNARVRMIGSGGGLVYGPLGPTHVAIDDIGIFRTIPNMTIIVPADAEEMTRLMPLTLEHPGPMYIRLAKGGDPIVTDATMPFEVGKAYKMREGNDALVVSTGVMLKVALDAAALLAGQGIDTAVLHMPTVKPLDRDALLQCAGPVRAVVSVEEHSVIGGLGSAVAEVIAEAGFDRPKRFRRFGVPDVFPDKYGSQTDLLTHYGLTASAVATAVQSSIVQYPPGNPDGPHA